MLSARQIEQMIRDTGGVQVVVGGVCTWGHLEEVEEALFQETDRTGRAELKVLGVARTLRVATGILPGLVEGVAVTADETAYVLATAPLRVEDGKVSLLTLANP